MSKNSINDQKNWNKGTCFYLMLLLLFVLFVLPFVNNALTSDLAVDLLFSTVMLLGIYSFTHSKIKFRIGIFLLLLALGFRWSFYFSQILWIGGASQILGSIFLFYNLVLILLHILQEKNISTNTIYGGISAYLLIALCFSTLYYGIFIFNNNAFLFNGALESIDVSINTNPFGNFTYYSLITLSTVGYGEITPYSLAARYAAAFQGILGQLYMTIFLARLVGLHIAQNQDR